MGAHISQLSQKQTMVGFGDFLPIFDQKAAQAAEIARRKHIVEQQKMHQALWKQGRLMHFLKPGDARINKALYVATGASIIGFAWAQYRMQNGKKDSMF